MIWSYRMNTLAFEMKKVMGRKLGIYGVLYLASTKSNL